MGVCVCLVVLRCIESPNLWTGDFTSIETFRRTGVVHHLHAVAASGLRELRRGQQLYMSTLGLSYERQHRHGRWRWSLRGGWLRSHWRLAELTPSWMVVGVSRAVATAHARGPLELAWGPRGSCTVAGCAR
jgi:hypothetical protein